MYPLTTAIAMRLAYRTLWDKAILENQKPVKTKTRSNSGTICDPSSSKLGDTLHCDRKLHTYLICLMLIVNDYLLNKQ